MADYSVIDADGHIIEETSKLRTYIEPPHNLRGGPLTHSEPWDRSLQGSLPHNQDFVPDVPTAHDWLRLMDENGIELAFLYPTALGNVSRVPEPGYASALCRAYNN